MAKTPHIFPVLAAILIGAFALCPAYGQFGTRYGTGDGLNPVTHTTQPRGSLTSYPAVTAANEHATLTWGLVKQDYIVSNIIRSSGTVESTGGLIPNRSALIASIVAPGTIRLWAPRWVSVKVIGTATTDGSGNAPSDQFTEARMKVNAGAYTQLFCGRSADVSPQFSAYLMRLPNGTTLNFGGRYVKNGAWSDFRTTRNANNNVVTLVNGQTIPTVSPALAAHLAPYMAAGRKVMIGGTQLLVLMELGADSNDSISHDYSDMALLVTLGNTSPNDARTPNLTTGFDPLRTGGGIGGPSGSTPTTGVHEYAN